MPSYTRFLSTVQPEGAFTVLAVARRLAAAGKDVIELEIGDSPFEMPPNAAEAGIQEGLRWLESRAVIGGHWSIENDANPIQVNGLSDEEKSDPAARKKVASQYNMVPLED